MDVDLSVGSGRMLSLSLSDLVDEDDVLHDSGDESSDFRYVPSDGSDPARSSRNDPLSSDSAASLSTVSDASSAGSKRKRDVASHAQSDDDVGGHHSRASPARRLRKSTTRGRR